MREAPKETEKVEEEKREQISKEIKVEEEKTIDQAPIEDNPKEVEQTSHLEKKEAHGNQETGIQ